MNSGFYNNASIYIYIYIYTYNAVNKVIGFWLSPVPSLGHHPSLGPLLGVVALATAFDAGTGASLPHLHFGVAWGYLTPPETVPGPAAGSPVLFSPPETAPGPAAGSPLLFSSLCWA